MPAPVRAGRRPPGAVDGAIDDAGGSGKSVIALAPSTSRVTARSSKGSTSLPMVCVLSCPSPRPARGRRGPRRGSRRRSRRGGRASLQAHLRRAGHDLPRRCPGRSLRDCRSSPARSASPRGDGAHLRTLAAVAIRRRSRTRTTRGRSRARGIAASALERVRRCAESTAMANGFVRRDTLRPPRHAVKYEPRDRGRLDAERDAAPIAPTALMRVRRSNMGSTNLAPCPPNSTRKLGSPAHSPHRHEPHVGHARSPLAQHAHAARSASLRQTLARAVVDVHDGDRALGNAAVATVEGAWASRRCATIDARGGRMVLPRGFVKIAAAHASPHDAPLHERVIARPSRSAATRGGRALSASSACSQATWASRTRSARLAGDPDAVVPITPATPAGSGGRCSRAGESSWSSLRARQSRRRASRRGISRCSAHAACASSEPRLVHLDVRDALRQSGRRARSRPRAPARTASAHEAARRRRARRASARTRRPRRPSGSRARASRPDLDRDADGGAGQGGDRSRSFTCRRRDAEAHAHATTAWRAGVGRAPENSKPSERAGVPGAALPHDESSFR